MTIILTGFPPETCGNDERKQAVTAVILGLDPGIQSLFNINTKDTLFVTTQVVQIGLFPEEFFPLSFFKDLIRTEKFFVRHLGRFFQIEA